MGIDLLHQRANIYYNNIKNKKNSADYVEPDNKYQVDQTLNEFNKIYNNINLCNNIDLEEKIKRSFYLFFKSSFLIITIIRLFELALQFLNPYILGKILNITTTKSFLTEQEKYFSYFSIASFIIIYFLKILLNSQFNYRQTLLRYQIKTIVSDLTLKKIMKMPINSIKNIDAKATKIINEDTNEIFNLLININQSWVLPLELFLALYSTYTQVKFFFLPGLIFAIVLLVLNYYIAVAITDTNVKLNEPRLNRKEIEIMAIKNIKTVKLFGLEKYFLDKIFVKYIRDYIINFRFIEKMK
jgi:ABC-type multidrug transport system fused ATPase/permease subunit